MKNRFLNLRFLLIFSLIFLGSFLVTEKAWGATKYFIDGGVDNNWSTDSNWSTESGGSSNTVKPTSVDDVVLDANSPNSAVDVDFIIKSILLDSDYTNELSGSGNLTLLGNMTFNVSNSSYAGTITISANSIINAFYYYAIPIIIDGVGINVSVGSDLFTNGPVSLINGNFNDAGHNVSISRFLSGNNNIRSVELSGFWYVDCTNDYGDGICWDVAGDGLSFSMSEYPNSYLSVSNFDVHSVFNGGDRDYSFVEVTNMTINGNNTFYKLSLSTNSMLEGGSHNYLVFVVGDLIQSSNTTPATLTMLGGGPLNVYDATVQYITVTPADSIVIIGGTDGGNNSGVVFEDSGHSTWYFDNEITTGYKSGASWADAFSSIDDITKCGLLVQGDTLYVKANSTPIRPDFISGYFLKVNVYMNATGAGTETGSVQQKVYGSIDKTSSTWTRVGESNVYSTSHTASSVFYDNVVAGSKFIWLLDDDADSVTSLVGNNPINPTDKTTLGLNNFAYDKTSNTIWINIGMNPNGKHIEVMDSDHVMEMWGNGYVHGGIYRFGFYGHKNNGCDAWILEGADFSYNGDIGIWIRNSNGGLTLNKNKVHDNGGTGIVNQSPAGRSNIQYNIIYDNGGNGLEMKVAGSSSDLDSVYNNTIYGNEGDGFFWNPVNVGTKVLNNENNISHDNEGYEFNAISSSGSTINAGYNCNGGGSYGGIWVANKGNGNVESDPLFIDAASGNYNLSPDSPAINAGTSTLFITSTSTDFEGNKIYGLPDIGAYEYQPPYTFASNNIPTTGSIRLYSDGKYRMLTSTSTEETASFSVSPATAVSYTASTTQFMDIRVTEWETTHKQWIASSTDDTTYTTHATSTLYTIGDLVPDKYYEFKLDGESSPDSITEYGETICTNGFCQADENGQMQFVYTGGYSSHTFGLLQDTSAPASFSLSTSDNTSFSAAIPTLSWEAAQDTVGISKYQLYVDNLLDKDNISGTQTTPISALSCNTHTWFVRAYDNSGNYTDSDTRSFTISCGGSYLASNTTQTTQTQTFTNQTSTTQTTTSSTDSSTDSTSSPSILSQLQTQLDNLKLQLQNLINQANSTSSNSSTNYGIFPPESIPSSGKYQKPLYYGLFDEDVKSLQTFLSNHIPEIYPSKIVSGYFYTLTKEAVEAFQKYHNIAQPEDPGYGYVGPKTRALLNELLGL